MSCQKVDVREFAVRGDVLSDFKVCGKLTVYLRTTQYLEHFAARYENGNFADGEYLLALRLKSKLFDLRVGYANPWHLAQSAGAGFSHGARHQKRDRHQLRGAYLFFGDPMRG